MAFSLSDVLTAARERHPALHPSRVPDGVGARWLSDYQNALLDRCVARDASYCAQRAVVALALGGTDVPVVGSPTVGATGGTGDTVTLGADGAGTPTVTLDATVAAVTTLPAVDTATRYLVTVASDGTATLDTTAPLTITTDRGVPLPPFRVLLRALVRTTSGAAAPLAIVTPAQRWSSAQAVWTEGGQVYLAGSSGAWTGVASIELTYSPVAPPLTARGDLLLLPDAARPCVVAQLAAFLAQHVAGMDGTPITPAAAGQMAAQGMAAEQDYLSALRLSRRARNVGFREVAY